MKTQIFIKVFQGQHLKKKNSKFIRKKCRKRFNKIYSIMVIRENKYLLKDNSKLFFYQNKFPDVNDKMVLSGYGCNRF